LEVVRTSQGDYLNWNGAKDSSDGPYLVYNIYASEEYPVDVSKAENLITTRHLGEQLAIRRSADKPMLHYAVTAQDRYGNESMPIQEPLRATTSEKASYLLPNDGRTLKVGHPTDDHLLTISTLQGNKIRQFDNKDEIDISSMEEGVYQLHSTNKKKKSRRIGIFVIKR